MPKHAKSTKRKRNEAMLKGILKHLRNEDLIGIQGRHYTPRELAAVYQRHLDKLDEVAEKEATWRAAVQEESAMERYIKTLTVWLDLYLRATFGKSAAKLLEFGLKPRTPAKVSALTKLRAVEKRRATRQARFTMGPKQRRKLKGTT